MADRTLSPPVSITTVASIGLIIVSVVLFIALISLYSTPVTFGQGSLMTGNELSAAERAQARRMSRAVVLLVASAISFSIGWTMRGSTDE